MSLDHAQKAAKKCPRIHALKTPPRANLLNRKTRGVYLEVLTGGFGGSFCGTFLGLAGGFRGGRAPADFLLSAGGFSGGFFVAFFGCILRPEKSTAKIHHFNGGLLEDFPQ